MSTLKSSAENLTLNADGSGNDIKFQSNGVEKASIDQDGNLVLSGTLTSVGIDDNANATAITIDSSERVGIGTVSPSSYYSGYDDLVVSTSGHTGMTIVAGTSSISAIAFADGTSGQAQYEGEISYNHSTNILGFGTAGTRRIYIDATGAVTMPNQPVASFGWSSDVATTTIIPASVILVNIGSHLTSAGRFTAPIAGTYSFYFTGMSLDASANFKVELYKNGSLVNNSTRTFSHTIQYSHGTTLGFITLAASDYLEFRNALAPLHANYGQASFHLLG